MAPIQRVNSVAVSTDRFAAVGLRLQQDDFVKMLVDCGHEPEHIVGIQYLPHRKIVVVKFRKSEHYSKFLELDTVKVSGVPCRLYDMSSSHTLVTVLGAPFEMEKDDIATLLSRYGQVLSIRPRRLTCSANSHFNILPDGTWLVNMDVREPIPSYLNVNDEQIVIHYYGQPKTCRLCGSTDHLARDCRPQGQVDTAVDPMAFPSLADARARSSTDTSSHHPLEPASPGGSGQLTVKETDVQESNVTDECQQTEKIVDDLSLQNTTYSEDVAQESEDNTSNPELPSAKTPTPVIKIRAAGVTSKPAVARIEKNQKTKAKKTPNPTGPPSSTTAPNSKRQLRPIRKRPTTSVTSVAPTKEDVKEDPPETGTEQFIDLGKNYVVSIGVPGQTIKEN